MAEAPLLRPPGFVHPAPSMAGLRGSESHRRALEIAGRQQSRSWGLDDFHRVKLAYFVKQRHFPRRLANFIRYRRERGRVATVGYFPPVLGIEVFGRCNLRCPGCPTGRRLPEGQRKRVASLDVVTGVIEEAYPRSLQLGFVRQGEPLLSDVFYTACESAARRGLWTVVQSNLSHDRPQLADDLCDSGLHNLVVSCDGATQEGYAAYRRSGSLELVLDNVRRVVEQKRRRGTRFPWITMKFLIFDHNWHEIEAFETLARKTGADEVVFFTAFSSVSDESGKAADDHEFDLESLGWKRRSFGACNFVWDELQLDYDGAVLPCCWAHTDEHLFVSPEDARRMTLMERWNSPAYRATRSYFMGAGKRADLHPMCQSCELVEQHAQRTRA